MFNRVNHSLKYRTEKFRRHMIDETEDFLADRLGPKPRDPKFQSARERRDTHPYKMPAETPRRARVDSWMTPSHGILVEIETDERGCLGDEHLRQLVERLFYFAHERGRGDMLLDLTDVRSIPYTMLKILDSFQQHLRQQGRRVYCSGLDGDGVTPLQVNALTRLAR